MQTGHFSVPGRRGILAFPGLNRGVEEPYMAGLGNQAVFPWEECNPGTSGIQMTRRQRWGKVLRDEAGELRTLLIV